MSRNAFDQCARELEERDEQRIQARMEREAANKVSVRIIIGTSAYAVISNDKRSMDVLLNAGHSPAHSMTQTANELREKAKELIRRAEFIEEGIASMPLDSRTAF